MNESQLTVFLEYTRRFDEISSFFPILFRTPECVADKKIQTAKLDASDELQHAILRYFNLCCEEHYLNANMLVTNEIWELWSHSMRSMMANGVVRNAWLKNRSSYAMSPDFVKFFDECCNDN